MRCANGHRARVLIEGIYVVQVDEAAAWAGGSPEELRDQALLTRERAPRAAVVNGLVHESPLQSVTVQSAGVDVFMTPPTNPEAVLFHVITALGPERLVVDLGALPDATKIARLEEVLHPEAPQGLGISDAGGWFRIMWHGRHVKSVRGPGQRLRYSPMSSRRLSGIPHTRQTAFRGTCSRLIQ
jgi:hypothetical protein